MQQTREPWLFPFLEGMHEFLLKNNPSSPFSGAVVKLNANSRTQRKDNRRMSKPANARPNAPRGTRYPHGLGSPWPHGPTRIILRRSRTHPGSLPLFERLPRPNQRANRQDCLYGGSPALQAAPTTQILICQFPPPSILTPLSFPSLVPVPITVGSMGGIIPTMEFNVR
jgi:hypothetical protein